MSKPRRTKKQKILANLRKISQNKIDHSNQTVQETPVIYTLEKKISVERSRAENNSGKNHLYVLTDIVTTSIALGIITILNFIAYFILKNNIVKINNFRF